MKIEELERKQLEQLVESLVRLLFRAWSNGFLWGLFFMGVVALITFACLKF